MKLEGRKLLIIEDALRALIEKHQQEIKEIEGFDDNYYKSTIAGNARRGKKVTAEDLRDNEIAREQKAIAEIKLLEKQLFFSESNLLLVSNLITLQLAPHKPY